MRAGSGSISIVPRWLEVLLALKFFNACSIHELEKRNEENVFCLDCCVGLCIHCMPSHKGHKILQIRRYVYQDVLCLKDANKLLDCSFVQSYTTNSSKVVFLHQRPRSSQFKGSNYNCIPCHRSLQHPNIFCSNSCKRIGLKFDPNALQISTKHHQISYSKSSRRSGSFDISPTRNGAHLRQPENSSSKLQALFMAVMEAFSSSSRSRHLLSSSSASNNQQPRIYSSNPEFEDPDLKASSRNSTSLMEFLFTRRPSSNHVFNIDNVTNPI
ncbi:uncharacterized protein LOC132612305 [Lycium barbarum]|uniref:uncharacterized protein LOC132612305 n=1 Tax=Lycium barbarum TaxID=112863 RepID=UPI00293E793C|nr:uncharacterized protein LOC132612305 [Lycium barbarum]